MGLLQLRETPFARRCRLPHDDHDYNYQNGGPETAGFAGIKSGFRRDRFGVFTKARPGFARYDHSIAGETYASFLDSFNSPHAIYNPALDLGGVLEIYPRRHFILRADAGDAAIHYRKTTTTYAGRSGTTAAFTANSVLFLAGVGLRL